MTTTPKKPRVNNTFFFILGSILACFAVYVNLNSQPTSARDQDLFGSSAFHGGGIEDILKLPFEQPTINLPGGQSVFGIDIADANSDQLQLQFKYQCTDTCENIWLEFPTINGSTKRYPVEHPILQDIHWYKIVLGKYISYQKSPQIFDLSDLQISTLPMLTEKHLAESLDLQSSKITYFDEISDITNEQVILTSRLPGPVSEDGWHFYSLNIDISELQITNQQLTPTINTDAPLKLIEVQVSN